MRTSDLLPTFAGLLLVALAISAHAQGKSEQLFENCKAHERFKADRKAADAATVTRSVACVSYVGAAWQMYNIVTEAPCSSNGRTGEEVVSDYLAFTRKSGFLDLPQQFVLFKLFEVCYCGKEPLAKSLCP